MSMKLVKGNVVEIHSSSIPNVVRVLILLKKNQPISAALLLKTDWLNIAELTVTNNYLFLSI